MVEWNGIFRGGCMENNDLYEQTVNARKAFGKRLEPWIPMFCHIF